MTVVHDKYSRKKKTKQPRIVLWISIAVVTVLAVFIGGSLIGISHESQVRTSKNISDTVDIELKATESYISESNPQIQKLKGSSAWETPEWKTYMELNQPYWKNIHEEKLATLKPQLDSIHWIDAHWNASAAYDSYKAAVDYGIIDPARQYGVYALASYTEEACRHGRFAEGWEDLETWKLSDRMKTGLIVPSETHTEAESYAIAESAFKSALDISMDMSCQ